MRIEHVALNIHKPAEVVAWLCKNLGMRILRQFGEPPDAFFVADSEGHTVLEIYENPRAEIPDYAAMKAQTLHVAFLADDVAAVRKRLVAAGATPEGDVVKTPDGDELAMVRGPGGLAIQLMKRSNPLV
ncbi:MAG TPA: VOC family protein [Candidatus Hydrogenedentes bacterium]|nr:VOC family protein [Candidatus Hydrogenedentota bacterium]HQH53054.1 VOC family protein [Candidatus Hydrogenedentota bacterium]HQM49338.1 VOC family protein [Candidatus Hydrogenedentota bacterium]